MWEAGGRACKSPTFAMPTESSQLADTSSRHVDTHSKGVETLWSRVYSCMYCVCAAADCQGLNPGWVANFGPSCTTFFSRATLWAFC